MKGISIKKGIKNSVHLEGISSFIHFLIENKVPREIVIEYLKYQYADGTTNGKGTLRQSIEQYKKENQDKIDKINEVLNDEKISHDFDFIMEELTQKENILIKKIIERLFYDSFYFVRFLRACLTAKPKLLYSLI